jgi:hypothetical protein
MRSAWLVAWFVAGGCLFQAEAQTSGGSGITVYDNGGKGVTQQELEEKLSKAYQEYERRTQPKEETTSDGSGGKAEKKKDKQAKNKEKKKKEEMLNDAELQENLNYIKNLHATAEAAFKEQNYRLAAQYYASVAMADVEKSDAMVQTAKQRFIEMDGMAKEHLTKAQDAQLQRNFLVAIEELSTITKQFPFSSSYETAHQTLIQYKSQPDVAGHVELAEAEELAAAGEVLAAHKRFQDIAENPRYENKVPMFKARRRLKELQEDEAMSAALTAQKQAKADLEAPVLLAKAKNYLMNDKFGLAKEQYRLVVEKFPRTPYAAEAEKALAGLP